METKEFIFERISANSNKLVLAHFTAEWSSKCKQLDPVIDQLKQRFNKEFLYYRVDMTKSSNLAECYNVTLTPTFLFFKEGKLVIAMKGESKEGVILNNLGNQFI